MTAFLRLLTDQDKAESLLTSCTAFRADTTDPRLFLMAFEDFRAVPGTPFAYWASAKVLSFFGILPNMEVMGAQTKCGAGTLDDFRFLRLWWEGSGRGKWVPFPKGGAYSRWYGVVPLTVLWTEDGRELKQFVKDKVGSTSRKIQAQEFYFRCGITWPRRTNGLSFRVMPRGCIFGDKGPAAFVVDDNHDGLLSLCAIANSKAFGLLVSLQLARTELAQSFEVGLIQRTPVPDLIPQQKADLAAKARRAWSLKRTLDTIGETSHAFLLPAELRVRLPDYDPTDMEAELARIQAEIDAAAFDLYGLSEAEWAASQAVNGAATLEAGEDPESADDNAEDEDTATPINQMDGLLSWAVGVAFGRFDWRLATSERAAPPEPEPFDPLPAKSPGMLPDGAEPFHAHSGILVDDPGHKHDLARLVEDVLARIEAPAPDDVRRWLRREFFPFHLQRYSKSRRKAPIYWPLATASGGYTLWLYYPALTDQTLFVAANEFVGVKLEREIEPALRTLKQKAGRSRDEERALEELQTLHDELRDLRDELLRLAPSWKPSHDDGVQIIAAPLWRLFRHRPWQTLLRGTWEKLEAGDYDWAHLAMAYWPARVREKCRTDKSLAIAHDLEQLYEPPPALPAKAGRGRKKQG